MNAAPRPKLTYWSLDLFRGIAALWVVMDHAALGPISLNFAQLRHNPLYAFSIHGMLGVQIFFVISGFCIANAAAGSLRRGDGSTHFLRARLRRIYPPYFCALLATAAMSLMALLLVRLGILRGSQMANAGLLGRSPLWYLSQLTLTQVPLRQEPLMVVFWTLCYEIAFYSAIAIVLHVAARSGSSAAALMLALHAITVGSLSVLAVHPSAAFFPFDLWPQFGLGILVYDAIANGFTSRRFRVASTLALATLAVYVRRFDQGGDAWHVGSRTTFCVALGFAVLLLLIHPIDERLSRVGPLRVLAWVGTFSYSLYLIHMLPLGVVLQVGRSLVTPGRFGLLFVAELAAAVLTAYLFFLLCERPFLSRKAALRVQADAAVTGLPADRQDAADAKPVVA